MKNIIKKWYERLGFPKKYDEEFYAALSSLKADIPENPKDFRDDEHTAPEALLAYLYYCEPLSEKYAALGIPEDVLLDTLSDLVVWTNTHYTLHGEVGLSQTGWLINHVTFSIFKLGRLQFGFTPAECDIHEINVKKGDPILAVHIPEGAPMTPEACKDSLERAPEFFARYFPDYNWKCFTCHSWLLDKTLLGFISADSNIAKFRELFTIVKSDVEDAAIRYVFRWDATRESLPTLEAKSTLAKKMKEYVLGGGVLYASLGYINRA